MASLPPHLHRLHDTRLRHGSHSRKIRRTHSRWHLPPAPPNPRSSYLALPIALTPSDHLPPFPKPSHSRHLPLPHSSPPLAPSPTLSRNSIPITDMHLPPHFPLTNSLQPSRYRRHRHQLLRRAAARGARHDRSSADDRLYQREAVAVSGLCEGRPGSRDAQGGARRRRGRSAHKRRARRSDCAFLSLVLAFSTNNIARSTFVTSSPTTPPPHSPSPPLSTSPPLSLPPASSPTTRFSSSTTSAGDPWGVDVSSSSSGARGSSVSDRTGRARVAGRIQRARGRTRISRIFMRRFGERCVRGIRSSWCVGLGLLGRRTGADGLFRRRGRRSLSFRSAGFWRTV